MTFMFVADAPEDRHLVLAARGVLGCSQAPPVSHVRPSATVLFKSAARFYGPEAAGVLLTGMGEDGAAGLKAIHDAGGITLAQDEASSVVYGMPRAAAELGAVDLVLPHPATIRNLAGAQAHRHATQGLAFWIFHVTESGDVDERVSAGADVTPGGPQRPHRTPGGSP